MYDLQDKPKIRLRHIIVQGYWNTEKPPSLGNGMQKPKYENLQQVENLSFANDDCNVANQLRPTLKHSAF